MTEPLAGNPFDYRATKDGKVFITWHGKPARTLSGKEAAKFLRDVERIAEHDAQHLMARLTGNFKRGNEKVAKRGMGDRD